MDGREMIHWILLLEFSILLVQAFNNRPVDHQRKILVRMVWPGGHVTSPPEEDTTPQPVVIPAATFSRQMVIRFPSSGSIHPTESKPSSVSSAGYDPFATEESADYSLDSYVSLSLSSGGSDAEGADQNLRGSNFRNEKSFDGSKLDLLQQLLRFAPSAVGDENADKCNDPFHSWICNNNKEIDPSATNPPAVTTTGARKQPEFFPASSFENVQILIPDVSPTIVPPLPAPPILPVQERAQDSWAGMDPCNHPFHSWMCAKQRPKIIRPTPEFKETGASIVDQNLLLPPVELTASKPTTTPAPLPATTQRSGWDGVDPCTHPFHSWLCDKRQPVARTSSPRPPPPTTTTAQPFIPEASFFIPDINPPAALPATTQPPPPPPPTTLIPLLIRTLAPKKGWDEADSCSHPFHSWLCEKPKMRTTTPQATLPPPPTTTTTAAPIILPPPEEAVVLEPAPSMEEANQLVLDALPAPPATTTTTTTTKPTKSSGWDEADSCSHPFHSWLCAKPPVKTRTTRPPTTTVPPLPADSQLPDASNFETLDALPQLPPQMVTTQKPVARVAATESSDWAQGADPCTHPFHSWLCNRSPSVAQNLQLRPILRTGRQSDRTVQSESEALDEENLESSRWNKFESLRLPPSSVRQRK